MLEILNIIYFFLVFVVIFSFPFNQFTVNQIFKIKNLNFFDFQSLNIIFFCYIILLLSFFNLNLKLIYYFYILTCFFYICVFYKKKIVLNRIINIKYFFFFFLITISLFIYTAHNLKLEWDGHHWLEKVVFFYNENKIQNFYILKIHPEYPHLGSYIWALFWKNSFVNHEYVGRLFCIYFYTISIFSLTNYLNQNSEKLKIFLIIFLFVITFEPYLLAGYQDYFLFSILVISSRLIFLLNFNKINYRILLSIILSLALLMWFKDEGLIYFFIFSFLLILNIKIRIYLKLSFFTLVTSLLFFNFLIQEYLLGIYELPSIRTSRDGNLAEINILINNFQIFIEKLFKITVHSIIASIKYLSWMLIFFSLFLIFYKKMSNQVIKYSVQCLIINLLFLCSSFMTFGSIDWMLSVALDRLFFQTSGFYLIIFIFLFNKFDFKKF